MAGRLRGLRWNLRPALALIASCGLLAYLGGATIPVAARAATTSASGSLAPSAFGEIDCNHQSPIQRSVDVALGCTDIRGVSGAGTTNTWGGRFYDNGVYIGHDEPDLRFVSTTPGSGNTVTWNETLGADPSRLPTVSEPGRDVTRWFELSIAPWFSMALCDPNSYPQTPCTPESDANSPSGTYPGGGSAFMELQFYPPGFAPFVDSVSCNNTSWCAALTIDSLECTNGFVRCNNRCIEPVNFAFLQTNGVPTGPPSPQLADLASFTPNRHTLLMNSGDKLSVSVADTTLSDGGEALTAGVHDQTTGETGFMQASAANGFATTNMDSCRGTPLNFQPEYSTASPQNIVPWAALQVNISTEFETGHFEACKQLGSPASLALSSTVSDTYYSTCSGPYESATPNSLGDGGSSPESSDALCYPAGDTHGALDSAPDQVSGCLEDYSQNGDLDFDGSPYWPDWPTSTTPNRFPSTFQQQAPTTGGKQYSRFQFQTDVALSEQTTCTSPFTSSGCLVPPPGPGGFYPYWTLRDNKCTWEFGNMTNGNTYGEQSQYGSLYTGGYPEILSPFYRNRCAS